ncbi:MAG: hypothetical protein H6810_03565 [Phycisphaeraceae bacterium]|nr:MAG: hypothetical protein H6810_03565 [Phycisphaeraceae bacterium]
MFATDRDLLVLEPGLLGEVAWVGQRLVSGTGDVSGTSLTFDSQDNGLATQGVGAGSIVLISGNGYEITAVSAEDAATVSRLRASAEDGAIGVTTMSNVSIEVYTFAPQIADVHRRVLRMLGLEPAGEAAEDELDESAVVNVADLVRLEALGALHLIYAGASAGQGSDAPASLRAELYRTRFSAERGAVIAKLDTDGDGVADVARRPGLGRLVRG